MGFLTAIWDIIRGLINQFLGLFGISF